MKSHALTKTLLTTWPLLLMALVSSSLHADDTPERSNHFHISASASSEVPNDRMTVILAVEDQDSDAEVLAGRINQSMQWALDIVRQHDTLTAETRNYQTWPRHDRSSARRIIGWSASQTLELESGDFDTMADVMQQLQEKLQIQSMRMHASNDTRRLAVDNLIDEALNAFKARAQRVQDNLGASGYRFGEISIDASGDAQLAMRGGVAMYADASSSAKASYAPAMESGNSEITVTVRGNIILD